MAEGPQVHRRITQFLSLAMCAVGVALVLRTVDAGGGPFAVGVLAGVLFVAAGVLRFWLTVRNR